MNYCKVLLINKVVSFEDKRNRYIFQTYCSRIISIEEMNIDLTEIVSDTSEQILLLRMSLGTQSIDLLIDEVKLLTSDSLKFLLGYYYYEWNLEKDKKNN